MFCPNCGKEIKEGYEFCMGCGSKIERSDMEPTEPLFSGAHKASRKSKKTMIIIGTISLAIVTVATVAYFFFPNFLSPQIPYAQMNVNNGAQLAYDNNVVVYVGEFDASDKGNVLVKANTDGSDKSILLDDENVSSVYIYNNKVFYYWSKDEEYRIHVIDINGSNGKELMSLENSISNMVVSNDCIFYISDNKLFQANIDGTDTKEVISSDVNNFCIDGRYIYFSSSGYLKKMSIGSATIEEISKVDARSMCVYDGYIFFRQFDDGIYKLDLKTSAVESLGGTDVMNFIIDYDKIYYVESLSDSAVDTYVSLFSGDEDENLVKFALLFSRELYSINLDGSEREKVDTETMLLATLYNTPKDKYVKVSLFSNGLEKLIIN
jgi:hypothetical protein